MTGRAPRPVVRWVDRALVRSPAQRWAQRKAAAGLTVLAYHEVAPGEAFARQVRYLATEMRPVSLDEVIAAMKKGRALPRRAVLVTFDDGHRSVYRQGLPVLRDEGVPAVVFAVAGVIGTDLPFWWDEVGELLRRGADHPHLPLAPEACVRTLKQVPNERRLGSIGILRRSVGAWSPPPTPQLTAEELVELEEGGIAVENHTWSHPCLDRCTGSSVSEEIGRAHRRLEEILGRRPRAFAYPNGNWDPRAARLLRDLGYDAAFLFDHRIGRFPPPNPLGISRVRVSSDVSLDRFRILVSGLHPAVHRAMARP